MANQDQSDQYLIDFDANSSELRTRILADSADQENIRRNSKESVELEQVLISLNDKKDETEEKTDSYEETLSVLDELDRILNIHDNAIDTEEFLNVEECLRDLDDYLQTFDFTDDNQNPSDHIPELTDQELKTRVKKLVSRTASLGRNGKLPEERKAEWCTLARNHRFRATISALRKELKKETSQENVIEVQKTRNLPPKITEQQVQTKPINLIRNHLRATTGRLKPKPVDNKLNYLNLDTDLEPLVKSMGRERISGIPHVLYEEEHSNACNYSTVENQEVELTPGLNKTKNIEQNTLNNESNIDFDILEQNSEQSLPSDLSETSRRPTLTAEEREMNRIHLSERNMEVASNFDENKDFIDEVLLDPAKNIVPINQDELSEAINNIRCISDNKLTREPHRLTNSLIRNSMRHLREFSEEPKPDQPSSSWLRTSMRRITSLPNVEDPKNLERPSTSWLRSSMRRIRHFRLPSDPTPEQSQEVQVDNQQQTRPFSAPVRVGGDTNVESVEEVTRTVPRSSSESSRSRRARSLSSSESSLASSVDSIPTCSPVQNNNGTNGDVPTNNNTRR